MQRTLCANLLNTSLFAASMLMGTALAASNPFDDARPGSRLPTIAENSSDKCAGSGADQAQPTSMPCGSAGKCAGSMLGVPSQTAPNRTAHRRRATNAAVAPAAPSRLLNAAAANSLHQL
jgi:hypothetical protein